MTRLILSLVGALRSETTLAARAANLKLVVVRVELLSSALFVNVNLRKDRATFVALLARKQVLPSCIKVCGCSRGPEILVIQKAAEGLAG